MKKILFIGVVLTTIISAISFTSCNYNGANCKLKNDIDTLSYLNGMLMGSNIAPQLSYDPKMTSKEEFLKGFKAGLKADSAEYSYRIGEQVGLSFALGMERDANVIGVMMNKDMFLKAFVAAVKEDSLLFSKTEANEISNTIMQKLMEQKQEIEKARFAATPEAQENLAKGEAWLAEKAKEEGVVKTESGLLYKVIKEGTGEKATIDSNITMNYRGTLIDGTEFDKNQNVKGLVSQFVPGFTEGLQLMNKGAKYELYIPASLGYGSLVKGGIPSNSVLIFEVELVDIQ